jgi:hypothetical protein
MEYAPHTTNVFIEFLQCLGFEQKSFVGDDDDQIKFVHPKKPRLHSNRDGITLPRVKVQSSRHLAHLLDDLLRNFGFTGEAIEKCVENFKLSDSLNLR